VQITQITLKAHSYANVSTLINSTLSQTNVINARLMQLKIEMIVANVYAKVLGILTLKEIASYVLLSLTKILTMNKLVSAKLPS